MNTVLEINNLNKSYGRLKAVQDLNLRVEKNNVFGILGPNGSGKTTTLGIVLGVIKNYSGEYKWFNEKNSHQARLKIGSILETPNFYPYLSAYKNLQIACDIKDISYKNIDNALKTVNLSSRSRDLFSSYSLGMKQRLSLASALLSDPEVIVLDEPTNGLDPEGIAEVREIIIKMAKEEKTIIIASHILGEVEKVCSHVAVIKQGKLLAKGSMDDILGKKKKIEISSNDLILLKNSLYGFQGIKSVEESDNKLTLNTEENVKAEDINRFLSEKGIYLSYLLSSSQSLETKFIELIKQE